MQDERRKSHRRFVLVQVAGTGKGCGKTNFICRMLAYFPGAATVKSSIDPDRIGHGEPDTIRFLNAGAGSARLFNHSHVNSIKRYLNNLPDDTELVFMERHETLPGFPPDLFVFVDSDVARRRDDADVLKASADFIVPGPDFPPDVINAVRAGIDLLIRQADR